MRRLKHLGLLNWRVALAAGCVSAILFGAWYWLQFGGAMPRAPEAAKPSELNVAPARSLEVHASTQQLPSPDHPSQLATQSRVIDSAASPRSLAQATNWRAWAEAAKPLPGGMEMARWVYSACMFAPNPSSMTDIHNPQQDQAQLRAVLEARDTLKRRCQEFAAGEAEALLRVARRDPQVMNQPLLSFRRLQAVATAQNHDERVEVLKAAVAQADGFGMTTYGLPLFQDKTRGRYFDGIWYPLDSQEGALISIMALEVACDLGDACGPGDPVLLERCAMSQICAQDRAQLVEKYFNGDAEGREVLRKSRAKLRDALRSALVARRVEAFVPPRQ
jgi:hypothetical protein